MTTPPPGAYEPGRLPLCYTGRLGRRCTPRSAEGIHKGTVKKESSLTPPWLRQGRGLRADGWTVSFAPPPRPEGRGFRRFLENRP